MRVLLVEDEELICEALKAILKKNGFSVDVANDGIQGLDLAVSRIHDIIILDRMLPGKTGLEILTEIRKENINTPVIFLTAMHSVNNRVEGLDAGADDYLVKPFAAVELLARIRALVRRKDNDIKDAKFVRGSFSFDPAMCCISNGINKEKLTFKESQLLEIFIANINNVLSKEKILDKVWGIDSYVDENIVETYVSHLRKKLTGIDSGLVINTIRGKGYCLKEQ